MKKKIIFILTLICTLGIFGFGYYHSTSATTNRLITAIQDKDLKTVEKYLPEYSDHSKINKSAYQAFIASNPSKKQIQRMLKDECKLVDNGWFHQKYWEPQKRSISISGLDDVDNTTASLIINQKKIPLKENGHQNFLPGNYHFTVNIYNPAYGTVKKKEKVDLIKDNQSIVFSPKTDFEKNDHLHKVLLASFSSFLISWNKSIAPMDFSNLKFATDNEKQLLGYAYSSIKEVGTSYSNEFSKVTIDNSSIEIETFESQPTIEFNAFINIKQSLQVDKDKLDTDKDYNITSNDGAVNVTMVYSNKTGHWEVDNTDFEAGSGNPDEWDDKNSFTLPTDVQQAKWEKDVSNV
nr:hypothetical protein [uncultured Ligilactobacillus sp.]